MLAISAGDQYFFNLHDCTFNEVIFLTLALKFTRHEQVCL